jgi:3'-phosphoadenosine 5'-phosphosulfate sulfotransferase
MPWSNENKTCMRVEKREFTSEFSQLSCPGQTRKKVAWELRSESLHQSFLNSHVLVKREQELHESWEARVWMRVFSTLLPRSSENKSFVRVDESWQDITARVAKSLVKFWTSSKLMRMHDSRWKLAVKREQELQLSSLFEQGFNICSFFASYTPNPQLILTETSELSIYNFRYRWLLFLETNSHSRYINGAHWLKHISYDYINSK